MDVINAPEKQPTMVNPTTNILTDDGLSDKIVTEVERVEQQSDQFNGIHRVASLFMHHSRCCNVYLDEMVARLTSECVASKSELKQQHEIIQELQRQLKTLRMSRMSPQTFSDEEQQLHQAQVEQEPTVEVTDRTQLVINETVATNEPSSPSDSFHVEQPDEIESAQASTDEFNEGQVIVTQPNDEMEQEATAEVSHHVTQSEIAEIDTMNEQSFLSDSGQIDQLQAIESVQSYAEQCNERNVVVETFLDEGQQLHQAQVEQEPTVEVTDRTHLVINETVTTNEPSSLSDSVHVEQRDEIENEHPSSDEFNEGRVTVTRSSDDVSLDVGQLNESEDTVQSRYFLRTQIRFGLKKHDGKPITYSLRSTDTSYENPRNCRKRSKMHTCGECKKRFNWKCNLIVHLRVHSGEKPYKCKDCSAAFIYSYSLKAHQWIHSGEKPYKCKECNYAFSRSGHLTLHQRTHTGEKPYKCKECNSAFSQSGSLKEHQRIHTGEKPYKCKECNYAFSRSGHLTLHQRTHTGEKPYKCKECNSAFSQSGSLKEHQRIHTGEKPYKCKECNSAFSHLSNLKAHQRIHSGEKPFMCDICKKSFRHKSNLFLHMDTHRGKKSHKCNVCQKEFRFRCNLRNHIKIHGKEMTARH